MSDKPWHHPINAPTPVNGPVTIVAYDPSWPELYETERQRIVNALGSRVLSLDHVGSTAVPGLAAKPIIDIMLVVEDCANDDAYLQDLEAAGYVLRIREPVESPTEHFTGTEPHRVLKGSEIDLNLHVWSRNSPEIERTLTFRDWLRTHDDDRALYQDTKLKLASQQWDNIQQYAESKSEVIGQIRARAMAGS